MFAGGDDALYINFVGNNPPDRIFQSREFDIALILQNYGEYQVSAEDVSIKLNGAAQLGVICDEDDVCNNIKTNAEDLSPIVKSESGYIPGGVDYIQYNNLKYTGRNVLTEESPLAISVEACYPYKTTAISELCITRSTESPICNFLEEKEVQNSGAPIHIKSVEQQGNFNQEGMIYSQVRIDFKEDGIGDVHDINANCDNLSSYNLAKVTIESLSLGNDVWDTEEKCIQTSEIGCHRYDDNETICEASEVYVQRDGVTQKVYCTYGNFKCWNDGSVIPCESLSNNLCSEQPGCEVSNDIKQLCGQDTFRLNDGETYTICEIPVEDVGVDFEERFVITLSYLHNQLLTKDISVMPANWE